MAEADRINFLIERDGLSGAIDFAKRALFVYRKAARLTPDGKKQFAHDKVYRASFVESILYLRNFLRGNRPLPTLPTEGD